LTTVVNNPSGGSDSGSGAGFMVGILVLAVLAVLFFAYGLPALRQSAGGVRVEVPDQIDVDVNGPQGGGGQPVPQQ